MFSSQDSSRRQFLGALAKAAAAIVAVPAIAAPLRAATSAAPIEMKVWKDPNCGCCKEWIKHMQKAGFTVTSEDSTKMDAVKGRLGVPGALVSCHTATVADYVIEGHVPADVVQKMLREKPSARGLAVPGMPMGSPGMEGPTKDKYNVMLFDRLGKSTVYASR
ncbi:MAG: DUF411 domain-containing protein [Gemmatimonas sp.]